jgi:hypothetical protein
MRPPRGGLRCAPNRPQGAAHERRRRDAVRAVGRPARRAKLGRPAASRPADRRSSGRVQLLCLPFLGGERLLDAAPQRVDQLGRVLERRERLLVAVAIWRDVSSLTLMEVTLGDGTTTWVRLRAGRVTGRGRIMPRLVFELEARTPRERMRVDIQLMHARLVAAGEPMGEGFATGLVLGSMDTHIQIDVPITIHALDALDVALGGERIDLALELAGFLRARDENEDNPQYASRPAPGEWTYEPFGRSRNVLLHFDVARSDWFKHVLEPIGTVEYVSTEIALPRGDHALRASVNHLREAERAFREGDAPTVFARCRAATEALPGAPKHIFDSLPDDSEREVLDELMRQATQYFHRGRHVGESGDFKVDHHDARFALNLAKLLIIQTARVLERPA